VSAAALFDRLAPRYDELWTNTPVGRAQRNAVWRVMDLVFGPGDRVLDIGCGTGEDAAHLAARGVLVHALDASPAMVAQALARGVAAEVLRAGDLGGLKGSFDGALSNFGVLNCIQDLSGLSRVLTPLIRPNGRLVICTMGRFCAWEILSFKRAFRRLPGRHGDICYPTVGQLRAAFAPHFELLYWTGIGKLVPPSYVKLPARIVTLLERLDRVVPLRCCADHRLLVFRRK